MPVDVGAFVSAPPLISRAIRTFRQLPAPDLHPGEFIAELLDFIQEGGHDMVIPADDQALIAVTEHYRDLKRLTQIACPPPEITDLILDKFATIQRAQECGIRVPNTKLISDSTQLTEQVSIFPFPWVVKPAKKQFSIGDIKSLTLATADQIAVKFPKRAEFSPPMLLQDYCPGVGVGIEILLHHGECVAVFQHRRLKEYPYTGGFAVTAVAERPEPILVDRSLALLRSMNWEGPAMIEFRVNRSDGSAVFMEVNGRYWGTISLPIFAGINFPLYHWQVEHGEAPAVPQTYAVGTKWRWMAGHVWRLHDLLLEARRSRPARNELLSYLPPQWDPSICDALFSPSDPIPSLVDLLGILAHVSSCDFNALVRRLSLAH